MCKMKKHVATAVGLIFMVVTLLFVQTPVFATEPNGDFNIFEDILQGYYGNESVVTIPDGIKVIKDYCFENNKTATKIIVPEGVESIGRYAFSYCENLEEVVLPNSLKEIGEYAFDGCVKLTKVTMPNTLTTAGYGIFLRCSALQSIVWPVCEEIPSSAFAECTSLRSVTIPEGVTKIGESAFQRSGIESLVLPQSLTVIEERCFELSSITTINIPSKVTVIPEYTFNACSSLQSIIIEGPLYEVGDWSFTDCTALTSFPTLNSLKIVGDHAFCHAGIKEITLPNVEVMKTEALATESLEKATIGGPITSIPQSCFQAAKKLKTVVLSDSIKRFEKKAFHACEALESINMPVSLEYIGQDALSHTAVKELRFSDKLTTVEDMAFTWCKELKFISFPGNVTQISSYFLNHEYSTVIEAPTDSITYKNLVNANYKVVATGSSSSSEGNTPNVDTPSNEGAASNNKEPQKEPEKEPEKQPEKEPEKDSQKEDTIEKKPEGTPPATEEEISPEEALVKDTVEKIDTAKDGDAIVVESATLDQKVLESLKGKDINLTLKAEAYSWVINGKSLTSDEYTKIDMSVTVDSNAIEATIVEEVAKEAPTKQISLAHNGEFGFSAQLSINMGSEYAGKYGNLYYHNPEGKLEFQMASEIKEDGILTLEFVHASDYVIVVMENAQDAVEEETEIETEMTETEENQTVETETEEEEKQENNDDNFGQIVVIIVVVLLVIGAIAGGGYWYWKKKAKDTEELND